MSSSEEKYYDVDFSKVKTLEDVINILKAIKITFRCEDIEVSFKDVVHLVKERDSEELKEA